MQEQGILCWNWLSMSSRSCICQGRRIQLSFNSLLALFITQFIEDGFQAFIFTAAHTPAEVRGGLKAAGGVIPKSVTWRERV